MQEYKRLGEQFSPKRLPQTLPSPGQVAVQGEVEVEVECGAVAGVGAGGREIVVSAVVVIVV